MTAILESALRSYIVDTEMSINEKIDAIMYEINHAIKIKDKEELIFWKKYIKLMKKDNFKEIIKHVDKRIKHVEEKNK